jgi:phytol kinase
MGELYFALSVGLLTFITQDKWIYMASLLQMSLADGFAAVMGVRFGRQSYLVFSHRKSVVGTLAFFATSFLILVAYAQAASVHLHLAFMLAAAALAAFMENLAVAGLDNLVLPVLIAFLLMNR